MKNKAKKSGSSKKSSIYIITACVIVAALVVASVFFIGPLFQKYINSLAAPTVMTTTTVQTTQTTTTPTTTVKEVILTGISIGGIDVSGMTRLEALAATANIPATVLGKIETTVVVDGKSTKISAKDLGITTDYDQVISQALAYGQTGSAEDRQKAADLASSQGVKLAVRPVASKDIIKAALQPLKDASDKAPVDAATVFLPWGFTEDGKAYVPDVRKLADAQSTGKSLVRPNLVKVAAAETPNPLRYLYWQNDHYVKGYIPADASIAHFQYTPEAKGRSMDIDALTNQIAAQIESGAATPITAVFKTVDPAVKVSELKKSTQLIASWTSSYHNHYGVSRNWNVSRMSSFINGNIIEPGKTWSVNKTAGYRTEATAKTIGWKKAAGIENGGYTEQVGGGVCQLGSTTFNAAIRAGITIASSTHHTIPSDYIPLGLDATLSTPSPDLVLKNDNSKPVYLVSYVNPKDQNVTVEVYGQLPVDPKYGQVIYDFTSDNKGTRYGTPTVRTYYNSIVAPDDTVLDAAHPIYVYAKPRLGTEIQTYKHIYSLDGKELTAPASYTKHKYPVINGRTYVFGPDPATVKPTPTVSPTPTTPPPAA